MAENRITRERFNEEVITFYQVCSKLHDSWSLNEAQNLCNEAEKYLTKKAVVGFVPGDSVVPAESKTSGDKSGASQNQIVQVTYYVLYSQSYSVPVLYLTACHLDGQMVQYDRLNNIFSIQHREYMSSKQWTTITQTEHPIIGICYMLHPCKTGQMMSEVSQMDKPGFYLLQWLSSVAPAVGLSISSDYLEEFLRDDSTN